MNDRREQRRMGWTQLFQVSFTVSLLVFAGNLEAAVCEPTLAPRSVGPQVADTGFRPQVSRPAFEPGKGPAVFLDEAHHNFHTLEGRYSTFGTFLRNDGFVVSSLRETFAQETLGKVDILVIANPQANRNVESQAPWRLPTYSAYTSQEIDTLERWVTSGGSLFLIADHMPFPGAVEDLARVFGIQMTNGFATDRTCSEHELVFRRDDRTLQSHWITDGNADGEKIEYVRSFTGQAFWLSGPGYPILKLPPDAVVLLPVAAWKFDSSTPRIPGGGLFQGAVIEHGEGRVAVFGEAAMFSAQLSGHEQRPMGMNAPGAEFNPQFLLNVMHWLAGLDNPKR